MENFCIPHDVLTICVWKSTYERCGTIVNATPFEPEWEGFATLDISNATPLPARVYANEGLCRILFFPLRPGPYIGYADVWASIGISRGSCFPGSEVRGHGLI